MIFFKCKGVPSRIRVLNVSVDEANQTLIEWTFLGQERLVISSLVIEYSDSASGQYTVILQSNVFSFFQTLYFHKFNFLLYHLANSSFSSNGSNTTNSIRMNSTIPYDYVVRMRAINEMGEGAFGPVFMHSRPNRRDEIPTCNTEFLLI
jgi:hypothetical protein